MERGIETESEWGLHCHCHTRRPGYYRMDDDKAAAVAVGAQQLVTAPALRAFIPASPPSRLAFASYLSFSIVDCSLSPSPSLTTIEPDIQRILWPKLSKFKSPSQAQAATSCSPPRHHLRVPAKRPLLRFYPTILPALPVAIIIISIRTPIITPPWA